MLTLLIYKSLFRLLCAIALQRFPTKPEIPTGLRASAEPCPAMGSGRRHRTLSGG
jgi:hypothetical protein